MTRAAILFYAVVGSALALCLLVLLAEGIKKRRKHHDAR